jgi:hypothetical protein
MSSNNTEEKKSIVAPTEEEEPVFGLDDDVESATIALKFKESDYTVHIKANNVKCCAVLQAVVESEDDLTDFVYDLGSVKDELAGAARPFTNMTEDEAEKTIHEALDFMKFWFEKQDPFETGTDEKTAIAYTAYSKVKKPICSLFLVKPKEDSKYHDVYKRNSHLYNDVCLLDEKTGKTRPFDYEIGMRLMSLSMPALNTVLNSGGNKLLCTPLLNQAAATVAVGLKSKFKSEMEKFLWTKESVFESIIDDEISQEAKEEIAEFKKKHNIKNHSA